MKKNVKRLNSEIIRKLEVDYEPKNCLRAYTGTKLNRLSGLTETNDSEQDVSSGKSVRELYFKNGKHSALGLHKSRKIGCFTTQTLTGIWDNCS